MIEPHSTSELRRLSVQCDKLFVYGILKRGYQLDLTEENAKFLGEAQLHSANLYRFGNGVGLRFVEDPNRVAQGEVFEIRPSMWPWLDQIEANGFAYTRKIVWVYCPNACAEKDLVHDDGYVEAWVYEHTYPGSEYKRLIENGVY